MAPFLAVSMLTAVALTAQVGHGQTPVVPQGPSDVCLGPGTPEMDQLLATIRRMVSSQVERSDEVRSGLGLEKGSAGDVVPVMSDSICARALRILKAQLGGRASVSESVAVVSVGGKYIARYWFRAARLPQNVIENFHFNREFTEFTKMTW